MRNPTPYQRDIIRHIRDRGGAITKAEAVEAFGGKYYANADFHVGNTLARMIKRGFIVREKRGLYRLATATQTPTTPSPSLFDL